MERMSSLLKQHGSPQRVLVALSGGMDSVALFCISRMLAEKEGFSLAAVHVHHGLRETADRDAAFCEALCEKNGVPFFLQYVSPASASENDARIARYQAFAEVYQKWQAEALLLAHHRSDQAETLLLHLFRGSGSQGLGGMQECSYLSMNGVSMRLLRPLLHEEKETLRHIAQEFSGAWCEDETNASCHYLRNYFRLQVLPLIKKRLPEGEEALCRAADILQCESDWMEREVDHFLLLHMKKRPPLLLLDTAAFQAAHEALRRRILRRILPFEADYKTIEKAARIERQQTMNLPKGWFLKAYAQSIYLIPNPLEKPALGTLFCLTANGNTGDGKHSQILPESLYQKCNLRYWQPGDFIQPFGMQGTKSMQDYFTDRKIEEPLRGITPLLCLENEVIWVIGVGASEKARYKENEKAVLLQYTDITKA